MRARSFIRTILAGTTATVAAVGLAGSSLLAAATPAVTPATSAELKTVPFEVSGELPIYPKALWRNGDSGADVRKVEARLVQLKLLDKQYLDDSFGTMTRSAVKEFQQSRGIPPLGYLDRNSWTKLTEATHEPTQTELFPPAPVVDGKKLDSRCVTGHAMCIDKTTRKLRYVVDGKVQLTLDVRFGAKATATREGGFTVGWKSRDHVSKLYDSEMPFAMFFSGGQAVHYSSDFAARGYNGASHGCVNVRDYNGIKWLFDQVKVGDKVIVYRS
ncbi:MAG TPA: L,D-transpeptidase family protein [Kribbella sp.]|nr:L,D-transpeptidase family protein [Kribbella sp.]